MNRLTEWMGEHAAVVTHHENYIDRLAAYEDTGLTPEEIMSLYSRYSYDPDHAYAHYMKNLFPKMERAAELSKADAEERVLVLPCKVGDTVYVNIGYAKCHIYEAEVYQLHVRKGMVFIDARYKRWSTNGKDKRHCWYEEKEYGTWGVDVFPTREDAERKLEGK